MYFHTTFSPSLFSVKTEEVSRNCVVTSPMAELKAEDTIMRDITEIHTRLCITPDSSSSSHSELLITHMHHYVHSDRRLSLGLCVHAVHEHIPYSIHTVMQDDLMIIDTFHL